MKKVLIEDIERLELISMRIEHLPKDKKNNSKIIEDMEWLTKKLREAYFVIEN